MNKKISRKYLEIKSLKDLKEVLKPSGNFLLELIDSKNFQLNKFFYKQIGNKYRWVDRLEWSNKNWISYISKESLLTFVLKENKNPVGYFELIIHEDKNECEVAYFGILEEYFGKKLGGFLLSEAIKKSFALGIQRIWLHTSSLDHKNALNNYLARGMTVFKSEVRTNI